MNFEKVIAASRKMVSRMLGTAGKAAMTAKDLSVMGIRRFFRWPSSWRGWVARASIVGATSYFGYKAYSWANDSSPSTIEGLRETQENALHSILNPVVVNMLAVEDDSFTAALMCRNSALRMGDREVLMTTSLLLAATFIEKGKPHCDLSSFNNLCERYAKSDVGYLIGLNDWDKKDELVSEDYDAYDELNEQGILDYLAFFINNFAMDNNLPVAKS